MLDTTRLAAFSQHVPGPLAGRIERWLRQRAGAISEAGADSGAVSSFVAFVLEEVCGLDRRLRGQNESDPPSFSSPFVESPSSTVVGFAVLTPSDEMQRADSR